MVSIIIPVYNAKDYLARCLDSVISQTYTDIEIILVNDGSTDSSEDICLQYEKIDKRVHYVYKENEGAGVARYLGASMAVGEYMFFVDSDDYLENDAVEELVSHMSDEIDCVVGQHRRFGQCSGIKQVSFPTGIYKFESDVEHKQCVTEIIGSMHGVELWNKLFRTSVVKKSWKDPIRMKFGEDMLSLLLIFLKCRNIQCIEKITYHYEYRENSLARSTNQLMILPQFVDEIKRLGQEMLDKKWSLNMVSVVVYSVLTVALVKYHFNDAAAREKLIVDIEQVSNMPEMQRYAEEFLKHKHYLKTTYELDNEKYYQASMLYQAVVHKDAWYYTRLFPALCEKKNSWLYVLKAYINKIIGRIIK